MLHISAFKSLLLVLCSCLFMVFFPNDLYHVMYMLCTCTCTCILFIVIFSVLLDFITSLAHTSYFFLPLLSAHRCTQIWIYLFWSDFVHHFQTFMLHFPSNTVSTGSHHINPLVTNQLPQSAAEWCPPPHLKRSMQSMLTQLLDKLRHEIYCVCICPNPV